MINIMNINIIGFGVMGKQLASLFYLAGCNVFVWGNAKESLKEFQRQVKKTNRLFDVFGSMTKKGEVIFESNINNMKGSVTIECVVEDLEIKQEVYQKLKGKSDSYFTNTSSILPSEIGEKVNGLHFFNPINIKIVELYLSGEPLPIERKAINLLKGLDYNVIEVNENRGYIGNFLIFKEISTVLELIEKYNYDVTAVQTVYEKVNNRDIFSVIDLIGTELTLKILLNLKESYKEMYIPVCLQKAIGKNILGRKNKTSIKKILKGGE